MTIVGRPHARARLKSVERACERCGVRMIVWYSTKRFCDTRCQRGSKVRNPPRQNLLAPVVAYSVRPKRSAALARWPSIDKNVQFGASRIRPIFSGAVYRSVGVANPKPGEWRSYLPYNEEQLARHLQRQFLEGMSWGNYGGSWHIDHIVPMSYFSFSSPTDREFQACWALANLRPLWAGDNTAKRDRRLHLL